MITHFLVYEYPHPVLKSLMILTHLPFGYELPVGCQPLAVVSNNRVIVFSEMVTTDSYRYAKKLGKMMGNVQDSHEGVLLYSHTLDGERQLISRPLTALTQEGTKVLAIHCRTGTGVYILWDTPADGFTAEQMYRHLLTQPDPVILTDSV